MVADPLHVYLESLPPQWRKTAVERLEEFWAAGK